MKRLEQVYEGKAKILYSTDDPGQLVQYFKDEATAFDGTKKGIIEKKGIMNNKISSRIFKYLEERGIKTHFVDMPSEREMVVRRVKIFPIESAVRIFAAGCLSSRLGAA